MQVGQYAEYRFAGLLLQPVEARLQQGDVAAEAVDDEAFDEVSFAGGDQFQGADDLGEDAALVDVRHQDHRALHRFGVAHVGDIVLTQVDLRRAARPFDDDALILRMEPGMGVEYRLHRGAFVGVVVLRLHLAQRPAVDDHLGAGVAGRFEQHRVHVGVRLHSGGLGLYRLGATDLAAVAGDRAVEGHVLRLERRHADTLALEQAAQSGDHGAFTGIGGGALDHEGFVHGR